MLTPHVQNKTLHEEIDLTAAVAARPTDTAREDARPPESPKIHYFCYGLGSPDPWHGGHVTLLCYLPDEAIIVTPSPIKKKRKIPHTPFKRKKEEGKEKPDPYPVHVRARAEACAAQIIRPHLETETQSDSVLAWD